MEDCSNRNFVTASTSKLTSSSKCDDLSSLMRSNDLLQVDDDDDLVGIEEEEEGILLVDPLLKKLGKIHLSTSNHSLSGKFCSTLN